MPAVPAAVPVQVERLRLVHDALLPRPFIRFDDDRFPPGWVQPPHRHGFLQVIYVVSGRGTHRLDGERRFGTGDILMVDAGTLHGWSNGSREWLDLIDIGIALDSFQTRVLVSPLQRIARRARCGVACEAQALGPHVQAIRAAIGGYGPFDDMRIQGLLWQFLSDIVQSVCGLHHRRQMRFSEVEEGEELVAALERVITTRHASDLTLADLAGAVHVSPKCLCRAIRLERRTTPMRMLTVFRLKRAAALLEEAAESAGTYQDAARAVGISDWQRFVRLFRAAYGQSPIEFVRSLQQH